MRSNISKNVPYGCDLNTVLQKRQPQCCSTFQDNNHFHSLEGLSAAYNDALLCLANVGCHDSAFYHQIEDECHFNGCDVVPVFQEDDMEVWDDDLTGVDDNKFQGELSHRIHLRIRLNLKLVILANPLKLDRLVSRAACVLTPP